MCILENSHQSSGGCLNSNEDNMEQKQTFFQVIYLGLQNAIQVIWKISKIIIPVYIVVQLLDYIHILPAIGTFLAPVMGAFGLPGEAAVPIILSNVLNIYAGIASLVSLELTVKQLTILAVMITTSHSLFIETSVLHGIQVPRWIQLCLRIGLMIILGLMMNVLWRI